MGYLRRIKHARRRFNQIWKNFNMSGCKLLYIADYMVSFVLNGASWKDYFGYGFYKLRQNGRNEYITFRRFNKILSVCNDKGLIKYFRDKSLFNQRYAKYLHRDSLDLGHCPEIQFVEFMNRHKEVFVKEVMGLRGNSVYHYVTAETDAIVLYRKLMEDKNGHYIVEGKLIQHEALASFHPASVNSIRIVTVYDDKADIVHFMFAKLRMGNNGSYLDNTHAGGISGNIDIETGIINTPGYNVETLEEYIFHPFTGKKIIGFEMPFWKECKAFVEEVARVTPEVRYVGWDVVLLQDGQFALIEANDNADHDGQQIHYKGLWKEYKKVIKAL